MLRRRNKLFIKHDDNSVFTDYTEEAIEFRAQFLNFDWAEADDYIYVGYRKPINSFFVEMESVASPIGRLVGEYYDGITWQNLSDRQFTDETIGLSRSGFVRWERFKDDGTLTEEKTTVDNQEAYWYRFKRGANGVVGSGLPEITTIQTVADSSGNTDVVWGPLTAGATDDGNGGHSGGALDIFAISKSTANVMPAATDFTLTYTYDGLNNTTNNAYIGVSSTPTVDDHGVASGVVFVMGSAQYTIIYEGGAEPSGNITLSNDNVLEFKRVGTLFTIKMDGVLGFSDASASTGTLYPFYRGYGTVGILKSSFTVSAVGGLNDTYFLYNTPSNDYAFYNDVDSGGVAPSVASIEIAVPITGGDNANTNAATLQSVMDGVTGITAAVLNDLVTATNDASGNVTDAADVDTGFTLNTNQQGTTGVAADVSLIIDGINIVFADDRDIVNEVFELKDSLPNGENSHILSHVSARDHIIQDLRNNGHKKLSLNTGRVADIEAFDLHDIEQINVAATYYAVSSIYFDISDQPDDVYMKKSQDYQGKFQSAMKLFYLSLDTDDDGSQDIEEELADNTVKLYRR